MYYVIVEKGVDGIWDRHYKLDPKKNPVSSCQSVYYSHHGSKVGVRKWYREEDMERMVTDIKKLNRVNPRGGYCAAKLKED